MFFGQVQTGKQYGALDVGVWVCGWKSSLIKQSAKSEIKISCNMQKTSGFKNPSLVNGPSHHHHPTINNIHDVL